MAEKQSGEEHKLVGRFQRPLGRALDRLLSKWKGKLGLKYWSEFAGKVDISPSVLANLRSGARELSEESIKRFADALGESPLTFQKALFLEFADQLEQKYSRPHGQVINMGDEYFETLAEVMMANLGEGDIYWLVGLDPPMEFQTKELDDIVVDVVNAGARIHYVLPAVETKEILRSGNGEGGDLPFGLSELMPRIGSIELRSQFTAWKMGLISRNPKKFRPQIEGQVLDIFVPPIELLYFGPFMKYVLIERGDGSELENEAWIDVAYRVSEDETSQPHRPPRRCGLRLSDLAVDMLSRWCHYIRDQYEEEDLDKTR